jgi:HK97 family phage major capsid protein
MKTVTELKQDYSALLSETEKILDLVDEGDRSMTPEETAKYDAAITRLTEMKKDIDQRLKLEAVSTPSFGVQKPAARSQPSDQPDDQEVQATIRNTDDGPRIETPRAYGKLVAFPRTPQGNMQAYRAGMWIRATLYGDQSAKEWCRKQGVGVRAALSEGVNTSGGALVPDELERAIIDLREE